MGYHLNLYSTTKQKFEKYDFFYKDLDTNDDIIFNNDIPKRFSSVFKYEFEIGSFIKFENKIVSNAFGDFYYISKEEFLKIIIQYNDYLHNYYTETYNLIESKLKGELSKTEEDGLMIKLYESYRHKQHLYSRWNNNIKIDENEKRLTNNWEFETDIIELVRIYKSIDFNKKVLIVKGC